jgi:hypothetical protein
MEVAGGFHPNWWAGAICRNLGWHSQLIINLLGCFLFELLVVLQQPASQLEKADDVM